MSTRYPFNRESASCGGQVKAEHGLATKANRDGGSKQRVRVLSDSMLRVLFPSVLNEAVRSDPRGLVTQISTQPPSTTP